MNCDVDILTPGQLGLLGLGGLREPVKVVVLRCNHVRRRPTLPTRPPDPQPERQQQDQDPRHQAGVRDALKPAEYVCNRKAIGR